MKKMHFHLYRLAREAQKVRLKYDNQNRYSITKSSQMESFNPEKYL